MSDLEEKIKDLETLKKLKSDLNNERYKFLDDKSKALILKSFKDFEFEVNNDIIRHNNNVELLEDMDIPVDKIELPTATTTNQKYTFEDALASVPADVQIVYLKDLVDTYSRGDASNFNFTDQELKVFLKSLRKYAYDMQMMILASEKNKETVGLNKDNHYIPLTQQQMRTSSFSSFMNKQNEDIKK